jgi:hypothetical protein
LFVVESGTDAQAFDLGLVTRGPRLEELAGEFEPGRVPVFWGTETIG